MSNEYLYKQLLGYRTDDGFCLSKIINNHDVDYSGLSLRDISLIREELQYREDDINKEEFIPCYRTYKLVIHTYGYCYFKMDELELMDGYINEAIENRYYEWEAHKVCMKKSELEYHINNVRVLK